MTLIRQENRGLPVLAIVVYRAGGSFMAASNGDLSAEEYLKLTNLELQ